MKGKIFDSIMSRLSAQNLLLKLAVAALTVMSLLNYAQSNKCLQEKTVVLVPPNMPNQLELQGTKASTEYLRQMGLYVFSLAADYSPGNVDQRFATLLSLYESDAYPAGKDALNQVSEMVKTADMIQSFHVQGEIKIEGDVMTAKGTVQQVINGVAQVAILETYSIRFALANGRFLVKEVWKHERKN